MRVPTADDQLARPIGRPLDGLDRKLANPESEYTPAVIPCVLSAVQHRENTIESADGPWDRVLLPQPWKRFTAEHRQQCDLCEYTTLLQWVSRTWRFGCQNL